MCSYIGWRLYTYIYLKIREHTLQRNHVSLWNVPYNLYPFIQRFNFKVVAVPEESLDLVSYAITCTVIINKIISQTKWLDALFFSYQIDMIEIFAKNKYLRSNVLTWLYKKIFLGYMICMHPVVYNLLKRPTWRTRRSVWLLPHKNH